MTTETETQWANRIVGTGEEPPDQLLANPKNWRIHPRAQQRALGAVLGRVGWVQDVIVNRTTGYVLDGHLRVAMAITNEEPMVPVSYVELDEREEDLVLANLDPLSTLAVADPEALGRLLEQDTQGELDALFAPESQGDWDLEDPGSPSAGTADDGVHQSGQEYIVMCPECGHEYSVLVPDE